MTSAVLGCGGFVPPREVSNEELASALGTTAGALTARTGVRARRWADEGHGPSDLAREASLRALAAAGLEPADVDLIVFATMTPDIPFPGPGCFLQHKLGCRTVGALDVRGQCAGFLFALATADRFVRAGAAERVLVAGGEVHSTALELAPRAVDVTPRFGDGAGVVILGPGAPGVLATALHTDPTDLERFWCEFPASRHFPARLDAAAVRAGRHYYHVDVEALRSQAEQSLVAVAGEALAAAGVRADGVALWLLHYIEPAVAHAVAPRLGAAPDRVVATAEAAGHIAGGGIPLALARAVDEGRVGRGDVVVCAAFGAGVSWAAAVLRL